MYVPYRFIATVLRRPENKKHAIKMTSVHFLLMFSVSLRIKGPLDFFSVGVRGPTKVDMMKRDAWFDVVRCLSRTVSRCARRLQDIEDKRALVVLLWCNVVLMSVQGVLHVQEGSLTSSKLWCWCLIRVYSKFKKEA